MPEAPILSLRQVTKDYALTTPITTDTLGSRQDTIKIANAHASGSLTGTKRCRLSATCTMRNVRLQTLHVKSATSNGSGLGAGASGPSAALGVLAVTSGSGSTTSWISRLEGT